MFFGVLYWSYLGLDLVLPWSYLGPDLVRTVNGMDGKTAQNGRNVFGRNNSLFRPRRGNLEVFLGGLLGD